MYQACQGRHFVRTCNNILPFGRRTCQYQHSPDITGHHCNLGLQSLGNEHRWPSRDLGETKHSTSPLPLLQTRVYTSIRRTLTHNLLQYCLKMLTRSSLVDMQNKILNAASPTASVMQEPFQASKSRAVCCYSKTCVKMCFEYSQMTRTKSEEKDILQTPPVYVADASHFE